jgi:alkane 1-monooxygenase
MFLVAMFPSWFRSIMDHRVVEWAKGDLDKIQIQPGKREVYERKFGVARPGPVDTAAAE